MPAPDNHIANPDAYASWRATAVFATDSLFDAAHRLGLTTQVIGTPDFHLAHLDPSTVDAVVPSDDPGTALGAAPPGLAVIALGGARTADRHSDQAKDELTQLGTLVAGILHAAPTAVVAITSRGATPIDDPGADFYGPGSSRHVPLILVGPGVRPGVVTGQPARPADIPATLLYALGAPTRTDVAQGTWAAGTPVGGVPQPSPSAATQGHALLRAFLP